MFEIVSYLKTGQTLSIYLYPNSQNEFVLQMDSPEFGSPWNIIKCVSAVQLHQDLAVVEDNLE